jgi:hypothetical protein
MEYLFQTPRFYHAQASYPLWLVLHGAFAKAEEAIAMFGSEASEKPMITRRMITWK